MTLSGRRVLLGVSGGIASYKTCTLARRLAEDGAAVDVVLTAAAAEFVRPVTFEALTGRPVLTSLWDRNQALSHLWLAKEPELLVLAPATANLLARAAAGIADDLLTAILLARTGPVLAAPAMNDDMYDHPATRRNIEILKDRGWRFVGPEVGPLAEGPSDRPGRMAEPERLLVEAERALRAGTSQLAARSVLVTAGPTREPLDPIRVITNRSSGRMGFALARAAYARGGDVTLIAGPTGVTPPQGPDVRRVETTNDLCRALRDSIGAADLVLMAAAPADFRPAEQSATKRDRGEGALSLALEATPDLLTATRPLRKRGAKIVGFAFETRHDVDRARAKLERKALDLVVLNVEAPDAGAETETNRVTLVRPDGHEQLPLLSKDEVAERILDAVEAL